MADQSVLPSGDETTLRSWFRLADTSELRRRAAALTAWAELLPHGQPASERTAALYARPPFAEPLEGGDTLLMADTLIILAHLRDIPVANFDGDPLGPAGWVDLYPHDEAEIFLSRNLQPAERAVTVAHELAHIELGHVRRRISYHREEVEADLTAALLAKAFEIDASQPTIEMLALHLHHEPRLLSLQTSIVRRALDAASRLLDSVFALGPAASREPNV